MCGSATFTFIVGTQKLVPFPEQIVIISSVTGFLNTNISPGRKPSMANYGLMDQIAALKWVQENIRQFGGDPRKVTLFGHNRGAACIHYLMQSPVVVPGMMILTFFVFYYRLNLLSAKSRHSNLKFFW